MSYFVHEEEPMDNASVGWFGRNDYKEASEENEAKFSVKQPAVKTCTPRYNCFRVTEVQKETDKALLVLINEKNLAWVPKSLLKNSDYWNQINRYNSLWIATIWNCKKQIEDYKLRSNLIIPLE